MAFRVSTYEMIAFEIPDGKGKIVELSVPPVDCFDPRDVEKINKKLAAYPEDPEAEGYVEDHLNPNKNDQEMVRFMLAHFNPTKAKSDAIALLVPRHLAELNEHWLKESDPTVGESDDSTEASSDDVE